MIKLIITHRIADMHFGCVSRFLPRLAAHTFAIDLFVNDIKIEKPTRNIGLCVCSECMLWVTQWTERTSGGRWSRSLLAKSIFCNFSAAREQLLFGIVPNA